MLVVLDEQDARAAEAAEARVRSRRGRLRARSLPAPAVPRRRARGWCASKSSDGLTGLISTRLEARALGLVQHLFAAVGGHDHAAAACASSGSARMRRAASMPSMPGMRQSRNTMS